MTNIREGAMDIKDKDLEKVSGGVRVLPSYTPACEHYVVREGAVDMKQCRFCANFEMSEALFGKGSADDCHGNIGCCMLSELNK